MRVNDALSHISIIYSINLMLYQHKNEQHKKRRQE